MVGIGCLQYRRQELGKHYYFNSTLTVKDESGKQQQQQQQQTNKPKSWTVGRNVKVWPLK